MDDLRKKVSKGLECCLNTGGFEECTENCPYFTKKLGVGVCSECLYRDALSLLKTQEPVAPKLIKMYPHDIYECGNCKHRSVGSKDYKAKYCPECGRKVKWDD